MNRIKYKIVLLLLMFSFTGAFVQAQQILVEAKLDTNLIMIGDQIKFNLTVDQDRSFMVDFPLFPDTIVKDVEIIERSKVDTTFVSDKIMRLSQEFTITSFDSGYHVIPAIPFPFRGNNISDTIESRPVILMVYTFQIDSVQGIADIKPPIDAPFTFAEAVPYIEIGLGIIAILVLVFWLFKKFSKKETQTFKREIPKEPAHVIALRELDALDKKKLWQQSKFKGFHSELTEIIRVYIEYRFEIMAMEQTSDEIIQQFERNGVLNPEQFEYLKQMLTLADYVKFAKLQPLPDENELSLKHAYDFVMKTKLKVDLSSKKEEGRPQPALASKQSAASIDQAASFDKEAENITEHIDENDGHKKDESTDKSKDQID